MAEEVEMTPVSGAEPPMANPLPGATAPKAAPVTSTLKLNPMVKPTAGALRPGLKLPPKPGVTASALRPGLKLPPKPGVAAGALKPGLKLPTQTALKPGVKLPARPVIRKPGSTVSAIPLPKPVAGAPVAAAPAAAPAAVKKPIAVDAQGVGKLPTVSTPSVSREDASPVVSEMPKPMEALKAATQKLKGITQEIPQQAILHKTGIIADGAVTEVQKEAAKHKTARISLSDAMGVAPVKDEAAPMKTIRIRRPIDIQSPSSGTAAPTPVAPVAPVATATPAPAPAAPAAPAPVAAPAASAAPAPAPTITQRKTLKIARPGGGAVRPAGKFGVKRPAAPAAPAAAAAAPAAPAAEGEVADIPEMPSAPVAPVPMTAPAPESPSWVFTLSALVQLAACVAIGALAWFLYQNTQTAYF